MCTLLVSYSRPILHLHIIGYILGTKVIKLVMKFNSVYLATAKHNILYILNSGTSVKHDV